MAQLVSRSDAIVALRSFGRRFADVLEGPPDDAAWERLVRHVGPEGHSAVGFVRAGAYELRSLGKALTALAHDAVPVVDLHPVDEPSIDDTITQLQADVRLAAATAGQALDDRRNEDYERRFLVGAHETTVAAYVSDVVTRLAANIRNAQEAVDEAR
jgi:hypothetical protein